MLNRAPDRTHPPSTPDPDSASRVTARSFVDLAQAVSAATRACGLAPPGFQTLPRLGRHGRVLRRTRGGAVVAIRTVGKSVIEVGNDMIEGVVRLQSLPGPEDAAALREQLQQGFAVRLSIVPVEGGPHRVAA